MNYYIHVPFCRSKCGYCAFYSEVCRDEQLIERYLEKLISDMSFKPLPRAHTVYIGGGTPTLLSAAQLSRLFEAVNKYLAPLPDCEISIESNPETLTSEKIAVLKQHITRISLGVQSFDSSLRATLGRNCSGDALKNAVTLIQHSAFEHFNCDLIYAVPGGSMAQWIKDLDMVVSCGVDHVSCYNLTCEEQSLLGGTFIIDDDMAKEMYDVAQARLETVGILRYEISNYARIGAECRHNVNVWKGEKLISFGPAAAGFDGVSRMINVEDISGWLADEAPEKDMLSAEARCREIFAVNLRTVNGWNKTMWDKSCFSVPWMEMHKIFTSAMESVPKEFYIIDKQSIRLSPEGLLYWNDIAERVIL